MAPRLKRRIEFDESRFVNARAQSNYFENIKGRKCIQDRVFKHPGGEVERIIQERGWENLCYNSDKAAVEVVKEFYANLTAEESFMQIKVRGFIIEFSAARINSFYEVRDTVLCDYETFGTTEEPLEEVINFLTDGTGAWKIKQRERINFPLSKLNAISKAWHYFICSTLLPTYHHSEVTRDRAILNFCIQNNRSIDIGRIIYRNILATPRNESGAGLGHPGLIFALCQLSGVEARDDEEWVEPMKPLTAANIKKYESHEGWRSGVRSYFSQSSRDRPSTSYDPPQPSSPTLHDIMNELTLSRKSIELIGENVERGFDSMGRRFDQFDQRIDNLERKNDYDREYLQRFTAYEIAYRDAERRYRGGDLDVIFPDCPPYTQYQPTQPSQPFQSQDQGGDDIDWDFDQ